MKIFVRKASFVDRNSIDLRGYNIAVYRSIVIAVNVKQLTCTEVNISLKLKKKI